MIFKTTLGLLLMFLMSMTPAPPTTPVEGGATTEMERPNCDVRILKVDIRPELVLTPNPNCSPSPFPVPGCNPIVQTKYTFRVYVTGGSGNFAYNWETTNIVPGFTGSSNTFVFTTSSPNFPEVILRVRDLNQDCTVFWSNG